MTEDEYFKFTTNVSIDTYQTKTEAVACLSRAGAKAVGKSKMAFTEQSVTVPEFLELATSGHAFCNLFTFDPTQKYWTETSDGRKFQSYPVYSKGPNKGGMKLAFKSDQFFAGSQTIFVDVDMTRFQNIPDYLSTLTLPPTCVYMSFSDGKDKHGVVSRRFRMVYVMDQIVGKEDFRRISQTITDQIVLDTAEPMEDDCGTRMSQYMNGVYDNQETYSSGMIYSLSDFPAPQEDISFTTMQSPVKDEAPQGVVFNEGLLSDMEEKDYATFMHFNSLRYRYFYRTEKPDWIDNQYQLTDDGYLQLWYYREKQVDGQNRRRKLFKRACLRRLIDPSVDADTLLFNLYVDCNRFFDNSDHVITLDTLKRKVVNAMEMTDEQLRAYCAYDILYCQEHRPKFICRPGMRTTQGYLSHIIKTIRWADLDTQYDRSRSISENFTALDVPMRTLYRYCADRGIDTSPGRITKNEIRQTRKDDRQSKKVRFAELYDPDKSLRENQGLLEENGLKISTFSITKWAQKLCDSDTQETASASASPFAPFHVPTLLDYSTFVSDWDKPEVREEIHCEFDPPQFQVPQFWNF